MKELGWSGIIIVSIFPVVLVQYFRDVPNSGGSTQLQQTVLDIVIVSRIQPFPILHHLVAQRQVIHELHLPCSDGSYVTDEISPSSLLVLAFTDESPRPAEVIKVTFVVRVNRPDLILTLICRVYNTEGLSTDELIISIKQKLDFPLSAKIIHCIHNIVCGVQSLAVCYVEYSLRLESPLFHKLLNFFKTAIRGEVINHYQTIILIFLPQHGNE